jgi:hypothetical protein
LRALSLDLIICLVNLRAHQYKVELEMMPETQALLNKYFLNKAGLTAIASQNDAKLLFYLDFLFSGSSAYY